MFSFSSALWYEKRRVNAETGLTALYLQVVIDGKHKEFPLKHKWPAQFIDLKTGRLLARFKKDSEVSDWNLIIQAEIAKHTEINRIYRIRQEYLDIDKLKNEIQVFDMRECFGTYILNESKKRSVRGEISVKSRQNAHVAYMRMLEFDKLCLFREINVKWLKLFKIHLLKKGYKNGTVWSIVKVIKTYLKLASVEPLYFVNKDAITFSNPMPDFQTTFLKKDEISKLMKLPSTKPLTALEQSVLQAFLFCCFTSIRVSDLYLANINWRVESDFLDFIPFKGRKKQEMIRIPLVDIAKGYIQNLNGKFFTLPTEPEYNRTLKDLAKYAEINKTLTSHVGRHTFGYLFMTTVGNLKALQEILGHKNIETTERYAHLDDQYKLDSVKELQKGFSLIAIA